MEPGIVLLPLVAMVILTFQIEILGKNMGYPFGWTFQSHQPGGVDDASHCPAGDQGIALYNVPDIRRLVATIGVGCGCRENQFHMMVSVLFPV